jgi:hypothetical protein
MTSNLEVVEIGQEYGQGCVHGVILWRQFTLGFWSWRLLRWALRTEESDKNNEQRGDSGIHILFLQYYHRKNRKSRRPCEESSIAHDSIGEKSIGEKSRLSE